MYSDEEAAALYDVLNAWGASDDFYLGLVMDAGSVLDVGCGTGTLLHRAREAGHAGRLCGLDPGRGMLEHARQRPDIEWVLGDLAAIRTALRQDGRFAFETRNPSARAWERWTPGNAVEATVTSGAVVRME